MANPSTAEAKQLSKAAGESYVVYQLARHCWHAAIANAGSAIMPNVDIIAFKGERRITLQVKATRADKAVPLAGMHQPDGHYFNSKDGPKADFIVCVILHRGSDDSTCCILPVGLAGSLARKFGDERMASPKRDGRQRSAKFPICIRTSELVHYCEA